MHPAETSLARLIAIGSVGVMEALLLTRLLARLFAARPDNLFVQTLYAVTEPLVGPLTALDAGQPRFGAVLEFSTLVVAIIVPLLGYLLWRSGRWRRGARATPTVKTASK